MKWVELDLDIKNFLPTEHGNAAVLKVDSLLKVIKTTLSCTQVYRML